MFIDRYSDRDRFSIFRDGGFNAVGYDGEFGEELALFAGQVNQFNDFCQECYFAVQRGAPLPPVPAFIQELADAEASEPSSEEG